MSWTPPPPVVAGSLEVGAATYPVPASGAVFVAPGGNDMNVGTLAAPKRTLAGAISVAPSGSTIVLRAGEYHEEVTTPSTKVLTIQAYPGEAVWFDGSRVYQTWSGTGPWAAPTVNWSPISSSNYPQVGDGLANLPEQVWINDVPQTQIADGTTPGPGQFSVNRATDILTIGTNPAGKTVRVAEKRVWMVATGRTHLRGFGVRRYSPSAVESVASSMIYLAGSAHDSTMENMVFRESGMHAMSIVRPVALVKITVEECGNSGIQMTTASGSVVSEFVIRNCNRGGWHPQPVTAGIKVTRTDDILIQNGIVEDIHDAIGVWFDVSNTRFIVANVSVNRTQVALESELSGGGFYDGVQHHSWFVNCHTSGSQDWAIKVMDSDYVTVANCDLDAARVSINVQQDHRDNTGTPGNLTFDIVPWVTVHNRLWNNRVIGQPSVASLIAYHDPATAVRDPDGGVDSVLLGWHFFDEIAGNWFPTAPPGSMVQLGKVDGYRNSYNTWALAWNSPASVGGPPGSKLGTNHQGSTTPADTIAVPLPDDIADLLGIPRGHQQVGAILPAPVLTADEEEPPPMTLDRWLCNNTDGVTCSTANVLSTGGLSAFAVSPGAGGTITFESDNPHEGSTGLKFTPGTATGQVRLPFAAASATGAFSGYHRAASLPPATRDILNLRHSGGQIMRLAVDTSGRLLSRTAAGGAIAQTATGVWVANRHNRIELVFNVGNAGATDSYTATIYDGDSTTPLATLTSSSVDLGTADALYVDIGHPNNSSSGWETLWDSIQMDNGATSEIGPYLTGTSGTLAATLPVVTASAAGTVVVSGAMAASLPKVTSSAAGTVSVAGAVAASVPRVTSGGTGTVTVTGSTAAAVPLVAASSSGTVGTAAALAASVPMVTGAASGAVGVAGSTAAPLPLVTASITGTGGGAPVSAERNTPWTLTLATPGDRTATLAPTPDRDLVVTTPPDWDTAVTTTARTLELEI